MAAALKGCECGKPFLRAANDVDPLPVVEATAPAYADVVRQIFEAGGNTRTGPMSR